MVRMIDCGSIDIGSIPVIHPTNFIGEWKPRLLSKYSSIRNDFDK